MVAYARQPRDDDLLSPYSFGINNGTLGVRVTEDAINSLPTNLNCTADSGQSSDQVVRSDSLSMTLWHSTGAGRKGAST
jgi:hypothetical protein